MDVECEESYRNHKESLQLFLEFNLPTCVAWCVLKHWISPIFPTDPRQDDVCTELRHRAEQADLEAQLGMPGTDRQIQLMRLTHLARPEQLESASHGLRSFLKNNTRDGSRCSHNYSNGNKSIAHPVALSLLIYWVHDLLRTIYIDTDWWPHFVFHRISFCISIYFYWQYYPVIPSYPHDTPANRSRQAEQMRYLDCRASALSELIKLGSISIILYDRGCYISI